jgi:uncharacterized membrane protein YjjP (DUF1212 family)
MDETFEALVIQAGEILSISENYQWRLGELSNQVVEQYGYKALEDFSKQINENCGVKRSPASLRMYAYIWKMSSHLGLPKDILFSACQAIVFSDDPQKYAQMARNGASGTDLRKAIYEDRETQKED